MTLLQAEEGKEYIIKQIETDDEKLDAFLSPWDVMQVNRLRLSRT